MNDLHRATCAICAAAFAVLFLAGIIWFGDFGARIAALAAAMAAFLSQFVAQDTLNPIVASDVRWLSHRLSLGMAYAAFFLSIVALGLMILGI